MRDPTPRHDGVVPAEPTGLLLLVTLAVVGAAAAASALRDRVPNDPVDDLRRRVASGADMTRLAFRYERGGAEVVGCILPNRESTVDVDGRAGVAVFRATGACSKRRRSPRSGCR